MPQIVRTKKPYNEWKGKSSPIGDGGRLPISRRNVSSSNNGGKPFGIRGNDPPRSGGSSLPRGGSKGHPQNENPRIHIVGPTWLWIGLT